MERWSIGPVPQISLRTRRFLRDCLPPSQTCPLPIPYSPFPLFRFPPIQPHAIPPPADSPPEPSMTLKTRLSDDMKAAMKSGDRERLGVIRLVQAAIKQREVDERIELDDAQVLAVMEKMLKQRRDSVTQYQQAQREDLAEKERFEIT